MAVTHLYGLTETYGPCVVNDWHPEWNDLDADEQSRLRARQGVGNVIALQLRVLDADTGADVPARRRDHGRARGARQQRHARLLPRPRGDRRGRRRRLVPDRGPGRRAPRRLRRDPRPEQGRDHLGRREHRVGGGRAGPRQPPVGGRVGGGRRAGRALGRGARRVRERAGRGGGRRARRARPRPSRALQGAQAHRLRRAAQDVHRQDPEERPAREVSPSVG